ncbi:MAG: ABC transporter permease [Treponema sp. CETP13]|nr:MAG: ABC transporter permease [Treponema sp. CETP13]
MVGQNKKKTTIQAFFYVLPALIIIFAFVIYPLIHTIRMSFYSEFNIFKREGSGFGLDSYIRVLKDSSFRKAVLNTLIYTFVTVPISLILALLLSLLLNSGIKASKFFQTAYFLPYVTNAIAIGLAFRFIFHSQYGILNKFLGLFGINAIQWLNDPNLAIPSLCIFGIWSGMAFKIVIFLAGLQGIDKQLYQAARIDEASRWSQFIHVTVPQLAPIISYQLVIAIIGAFKTYVEVVGLFGDAGPIDSAMTMVYYMFEQFYAESHYTEAAASGVLMFLLIMVFTLIQMKLSNRKTDQ